MQEKARVEAEVERRRILEHQEALHTLEEEARARRQQEMREADRAAQIETFRRALSDDPCWAHRERRLAEILAQEHGMPLAEALRLLTE